MGLQREVVVIGGGFGGLATTRALHGAGVRITLVDRCNHHLFQPLLYQVAMAGLAPASIAVPIRSVLRRQANARVLLDEVVAVDLAANQVVLRESGSLPYDFLVLAAGARTNYFGNAEWARRAPGLKDLDDAVEIRRRVLLAFEAAERESSEAERRRHLTFVVIGGGPTGVELAGAIAELAATVLARDFRAIHPQLARVVLVEGSDRLLSSMSPASSAHAKAALAEMGVDVRVGVRVTHLDDGGVTVGGVRIESSTVLWAAGVSASPLGSKLGVDLDRQGRVVVQPDCSVPGHPNVFCIGDMAHFAHTLDHSALPGVSPVAMQQGRFVARQIERACAGESSEVFAYKDKGQMATIGRSRAVAEIGSRKFSGFFAWLLWLLVHIVYLIDFRNRVSVLIDWTYSYFAYKRGSRLITGGRLQAGPDASEGP